ncbi:Mbov_0400 family ICE element protein [Mycoplasma mycoides]|uniref:Mbov_0400 family ICE element protein n=1 Tax=Mycoplasma mycoides TaxID=2102 RepID=UPI00224048F7|nr:integrative conjugal element protein [Mycoplasma mycoides]QVJ95888.1 integrative conjugal element protein [Mycoplasma mycoides subsp. capri]
MMIGKIFRFRTNDNKLEIARDRFNINIATDNNKLHRPYIVFYSDDKVYYLTVKTLTKKNKETVNRSKDFNVTLLNENIYNKLLSGNKLGNVIDCSVVNIMDKKLFEKLFQDNEHRNNYQLNPWIYDKVMIQLYENKHNLIFHEVTGFDFENNRTRWMLDIVKTYEGRLKYNKWLIRTKKIVQEVINVYHSMPRDELNKRLDDKNSFITYIKQIYYGKLKSLYADEFKQDFDN